MLAHTWKIGLKGMPHQLVWDKTNVADKESKQTNKTKSFTCLTKSISTILGLQIETKLTLSRSRQINNTHSHLHG